jgi:hypothetical protein
MEAQPAFASRSAYRCLFRLKSLDSPSGRVRVASAAPSAARRGPTARPYGIRAWSDRRPHPTNQLR